MKRLIQAIFQKTLGFKNYLYVFSLFKIYTLKWDRPDQEGDFNYFLTLLEPHFHILDIGANIGIMTVLMGKKSPQGHIYAFEPIPDNIQALKRVVQFHKINHVTVYPIALGEHQTTVQMQMPIMDGVQMQGLSHVSHDSIETYEARYHHYDVEQLVLDEMEIFQQQSIHAIKIDVENYEQFVFKGGLKLIERDMPLIYCELWPNENRDACFTLLSQLGYQIKVKDGNELRTYIPEEDPHHNFYFIP